MKNKKSIAMAMAAVSTMAAVAPAFTTEVSAAEIVGEVVKDMNLDLLRSEDPAVRIKANKDFETTRAYLEKKHAEKDTNGNAVYTFTQTSELHKLDGVNKVVTIVEISRNDNAADKSVETFIFTKTQVDQGFGQEVPVEIVELNINKEADRTKLSKMIYEINKNIGKVTVVKSDDSQEAKLTLTVYAGKVGEDQIKSGEAVALAHINLFGNTENLKKVVLVSANNDFLGHWAEYTIVDAMIAGIVDNTAKFNPEQEITRAQFAKMICEANDIEAIEYNQTNKAKFEKFTDVSVTEWYAGYIAAISEAGLMNGDGNGTFRPEEKISRQEVAVVLATLHNGGGNVETVTTDVNGNRVHKDIKTNFVDDSKIDIWADESVEYLRTRGYAKGYSLSEGKFEYRPANNMSRAEALTMITRVSK